MLKSIVIWILRGIYYLLYHQFAWTYDYVAAIVSLGRWNNWVHHALPFLTGSRILEIGFGPGHLLITSLSRQINIVGVDESKQMVRRASRKIYSLGFALPIIRGNVYTLPFPECHFDQVVSTFPSEYIFNKTALLEVFRVLQPGGQFIILPVAWIQGKLWYEKLTHHLVDFNEVTHTWEEKYSQAIRQEGFEISFIQIHDYRSAMLFIIGTKPNVNNANQLEK
jgi:ubiquinone/menaquinone biosynthesis C-methylase UbiE